MQLFALLLPALAAAGLLGSNADAGDESPRLASVSTSGAPVATLGAALEVLELREAHGGHNGMPAANPGLVPAVAVQPVSVKSTTTTTTKDPEFVPAVAVEPVSTTESTTDAATSITHSSVVAPTSSILASISTASDSATTSTSSNTKIVITDYTTVKWYESWVGGTYSTWFPTTITVHPPFLTPAPRPGKGEIGMGTLTGELGVTSTIVPGAALSQAPGWAKGVAAAIGAGFVGMVV